MRKFFSRLKTKLVASVPTPQAGYATLYVDSADGGAKLKDSAGSVTALQSNTTLLTNDAALTRRIFGYQIFPGSGTWTAWAGASALTSSGGSVANGDDADGSWATHTTGAVSGNIGSPNNTNVSHLRRDWGGSAGFRCKPVTLTNVRIWVGLSSSASGLTGSSAPNNHVAAFRYDTGVDGTAFWRCVTIAGTGASAEVTTTTVPFGANVYNMRIDLSSSNVKFYIDGVLVATHTAQLPTATQMLCGQMCVTTLTAAAASFKRAFMHFVTP